MWRWKSTFYYKIGTDRVKGFVSLVTTESVTFDVTHCCGWILLNIEYITQYTIDFNIFIRLFSIPHISIFIYHTSVNS